MGIMKLPPELLYQIIREATILPTLTLNGLGYDPISTPGPQLQSDQPHSPSLKHSYTLLHNSLTDKVHISLVCRLWRDITIHFMYDFVIVRKAIHIPFLLKRLSQPHIDTSRILRLDILCPVAGLGINFENQFYPLRRLARAIKKLISLCTNLRVFSIEGNIFQRYYFPIAKALLEATTLEYLEWSSSSNLPLAWYLLKPQSCRLRSFHLSFVQVDSSTHLSSIYSSNQTRNQVASTSDDYESSESDNFSEEELANAKSLCSARVTSSALVFDGSETGEQDQLIDIGCGRFISLYPIKHINFGFNSVFGRSSHRKILLQINTLTLASGVFRSVDLSRFPENIHTMIFYLKDVSMMMEGVSRVKRLGLKGTELPSPAEFDAHFVTLTGFGSPETNFPNLNVIQFVDAALAREIEKRPLQLRLWAHRCRLRGISLRDETGRIMSTDHI